MSVRDRALKAEHDRRARDRSERARRVAELHRQLKAQLGLEVTEDSERIELDDFTFYIDHGELMASVQHSGCGHMLFIGLDWRRGDEKWEALGQLLLKATQEPCEECQRRLRSPLLGERLEGLVRQVVREELQHQHSEPIRRAQ